MSIKDNLKQIQEEFGNERMFERAFKFEVFFKKNKIWILSIFAGALIWGITYQIRNYFKEQNALEATAIFDEIKKNGSNEDLLNRLKNKSDALYELVVFSEAIKKQNKTELQKIQESKNPFISQYAHYEYSSLMQNFDQRDYGDFKDLVLLEEGYLLILRGKYQLALEKLNEIAPTSELKDLALRIRHYGIAF